MTVLPLLNDTDLTSVLVTSPDGEFNPEKYNPEKQLSTSEPLTYSLDVAADRPARISGVRLARLPDCRPGLVPDLVGLQKSVLALQHPTPTSRHPGKMHISPLFLLLAS